MYSIPTTSVNRSMGPMGTNMESNDERLLREVVRLNSITTGIAFGILGGLLIFLATLWLVLQGGLRVGQHLMLLGNYFPGYRVTFLGSIIGFGYGFITGFFTGAMIGWIYNLIVRLRDR
jgi:hypothetical protein